MSCAGHKIARLLLESALREARAEQSTVPPRAECNPVPGEVNAESSQQPGEGEAKLAASPAQPTT
jgi:hypothetical protein